MQIIDLYIREGKKHTSEGDFPTTTRLVDTSTDFTNGNFKVGQLIKNLNSGVIGSITAIAPSGNDTLDITGGNFSGTAQPYQIYDDYTKLELFKDESVSIIDTIQNVKDPAKIFAPFSQQFSVPASKHNNKFFKHYYNSEIQNSFDARFQGDGLIQLNGVTYKVGKLRLTSVELKNNVAYSYKLVFTGETIEFKEILAEDELSSLIYPSSLDFNYTNDFVRSKLQGSAEGDDLIFPLITHSKNMRYNYNGNPGYRDAITGTHLTFTDLKPAIKTKVILNAIQTTYPQIVFSPQFFNTAAFTRLYMWLHREEGYMSNAIEGGDVQTISTRFRSPGPNGDGINGEGYSFVSGTELRLAICRTLGVGADPDVDATSGYVRYRYKFYLDVSAPGTTSYTIECRRTSNNSLMWSNDRTGSASFDWQFENSDFNNSYVGQSLVDFTINIITENTLAISQDLTVEYNRRYSGSGSAGELLDTGVYEKAAVASANTISINRQIPKMKIFDFLKNIFTMFNLTAYKEDGIITVLPLDDYYNAGKTYDITEYVDTSKKTVSKLLQFKNMKFNFKSKKSYLVQYSEELQGNIFSEESYGNDEFDGNEYKIEVDFEKMMYERLSDEETDQLTTIVQGAMLDKKFEPTIGLPLLFYSYSTVTNDALLFKNDDDTLTNINPYLRPSNSISNITTGYVSLQLNFGIENDEYTLSSGNTTQDTSNDLFTKYYRNYVANIFAKNARKTNVSAYLPLSIILKYRLNDIFVIGTTAYRINSIKTNLLTNKSDLELYNLTENVSQLLNNQLANLQRVENLETTSKTSSTIDFTYNSITDPNLLRYEIYVDDIYNGFTNPGSFGSTVSALDSDTTYKISVRAIYDVEGEEAGAFDTDLFETTL